MSYQILRKLSLLLAIFASLAACEFQEKNESNVYEPEQLKVSPDASLLIDSSESLMQFAPAESATFQSGSGRLLETVADFFGNLITADSVVKLNSRYVLLKDVRRRGYSPLNKHKILDLSNGKLKTLKKWPANTNRIVVSAGYAFYVSDGDICAVKLETGDCTVIAGDVPIWREHPLGVHQNNEITTFSADTWLHVDSSLNVYAIDYRALSNIYNVGYGAKYLRSGESWMADDLFNQTFFPRMPYGVSNSLPGSLLMGRKWTVMDEVNNHLYEVEMAGTQMKVRAYDIDSWAAGSAVLTFPLSHSVTDSTYIGINNSIQNGIITDGQSIIRIISNNGTLSAEEITVPAAIIRDNSIQYQEGYTNYWPSAGITNWNYLRGDLYYLDPATDMVYYWDLNAANSPTPLGPLPRMTFMINGDPF